MNRLSAALLGLSAVAAVTGVALVYIPAALIVLAAILAVVGVLLLDAKGGGDQ